MAFLAQFMMIYIFALYCHMHCWIDMVISYFEPDPLNEYDFIVGEFGYAVFILIGGCVLLHLFCFLLFSWWGFSRSGCGFASIRKP